VQFLYRGYLIWFLVHFMLLFLLVVLSVVLVVGRFLLSPINCFRKNTFYICFKIPKSIFVLFMAIVVLYCHWLEPAVDPPVSNVQHITKWVICMCISDVQVYVRQQDWPYIDKGVNQERNMAPGFAPPSLSLGAFHLLYARREMYWPWHRCQLWLVSLG
jgi:hypothetical protein